MILQFLRASTADAVSLMCISKKAFDSDAEVEVKGAGGPPGYNSLSFYTKMARMNNLYKLVDDYKIVGGALLFLKDDILNVCRIFVDPEYFRKGYGIFMMQQIEESFAEVKVFTLDTPIWNVRTNAFYTKLGYKEIKRDKEFVFYSKHPG
jgi:ribosomal protein S18 acetylase RimI-like enzyme